MKKIGLIYLTNVLIVQKYMLEKHNHSIYATKETVNVFSYNIPANGEFGEDAVVNTYWSYRGYYMTRHTSTSGNKETRPINMSIKIWKRVS